MNETAGPDIDSRVRDLIVLCKQDQVTRTNVFNIDRQTPSLHF